jgi:hypothetical protein
MKRNMRLALLWKVSPLSVLALGSLLLVPAVSGADNAPAETKAAAEKPEAAKPKAAAPNKAAPPKTAASKTAAPKAEEPQAEEKSAETEPTEYRNWFDVSVGGAIVDGDKAAFQRRYGLPAGAFGGVEDFHYEQDIGKKGLFKVDGRGIFDNHDYSLNFDVEHPDIGYVRGGYREYRSYFDGSGGYFGPTQSWVSPFDNDLALDRGDFFFETGLTLPNKPIITFRYDHQFRNGEQDSTSWGDLTIPAYGDRKIVPSFWDIDETRDIFAGDVKHTLGNTTFGLGLRYELSKTDDSLNTLLNPGEASARYGTDREKVDSDLFNVHVFTDTSFTDKIQFTTGYSFTTLDTDLSGYRLYGTTYDPAFAQRLPIADTFENLSGGAELKQHVANLNLVYQLTDSLLLIPALRIEREDTDNDSTYATPAAPFSSMSYEATSDQGLLDVTERLELRYTGLTNWVFYGRGEWLEGSGDLRDHSWNLGTLSDVVLRSTDENRFWSTYTVGLNWYPLRRLNFGAQYYHKDRWNDYDHTRDNTPNVLISIPTTVYPAFLTAQDWTTDDGNLRVTWRPLATVTLVGAYDIQYSTIDTKPDSASGLGQTQSAKMTSHIVGGTASWTPLQRLYLQGGVNWVWDQTETPADDITLAVQKAKNDYWTANATAGYALNDKTDLEVQYCYYRADDLQDNSVFGLPYGADAQEHGVTASIIRRISQRMRVTLKYGFFDGKDNTSGEHNDYRAHLVYSSFHYRF